MIVLQCTTAVKQEIAKDFSRRHSPLVRCSRGEGELALVTVDPPIWTNGLKNSKIYWRVGSTSYTEGEGV